MKRILPVLLFSSTTLWSTAAVASPGIVSETSAEGLSPAERTFLLGGVWARHLDEIKFLKDGTYLSYDRGSDQPTHGKWELVGRSIKLTEGKTSWTNKILSISPKELHLTFGDGSEGLDYTRAPYF